MKSIPIKWKIVFEKVICSPPVDKNDFKFAAYNNSMNCYDPCWLRQMHWNTRHSVSDLPPSVNIIDIQQHQIKWNIPHNMWRCWMSCAFGTCFDMFHELSSRKQNIKEQTHWTYVRTNVRTCILNGLNA